LIDETGENIADHAEMVALPRVLAFEIDEIGGCGVQALRQQFGNDKSDCRIRAHEACGIFVSVDCTGCRCSHGCRVGRVEQDGHFTKH